jgi:prepilin-type N-terminal cleavage/methylation domain-containing protein
MEFSKNKLAGMKQARQAGFSLVELMIVLAILTIVAGIVSVGLFRMTMAQGTTWNRTEMHAAVRSATELIQQEVGQSGQMALPNGSTTLTGNVAGAGALATVGVLSTAGMFPGIRLTIGPQPAVCGAPPVPAESRETVLVTGVDTAANTITAAFQDCHSAGAIVAASGAFAGGVIPKFDDCAGSNPCKLLSASGNNPVTLIPTNLTAATGSTTTLLKLFGDINSDGNMVYVEYRCDFSTNPGRLTRRMMPWDTPAAQKPTFPEQALLTNVLPNPGGTPCFRYQTFPVQNNTYVINVAITLTVQTENRDPDTGLFQLETKALLNVSPRNVYQALQMSNLNMANFIQPVPQPVINLISVP